MGTESLAQHSSRVKRQEEQLLVDRCRRGDGESFAQLMRLHEKQIYNFIYRMLGSEGEAEDLTQDIFIAAFRGIRSFRGEAKFSTWLRGEAKFSTWLYRIALNQARNRIKYLSRRNFFARQTRRADYGANTGNASTKYHPRPDRYWYCGMYRVFPMTN
jgi:RNA polymerase sigma-70 factor (ECF subfamily)